MNKTLKLATLSVLALTLPLWAADNLLKPANKADSWRLETHEGGKAKMEIEGDAVVFTVTEASGTDWHVQAIQTGIDLKDNAKYKISFQAKADPAVEIPVHAGIDVDDWHLVGLAESAQLEKDWKKLSFEFTASDTKEKKNRISFVLGGNKGKVWIKDLVLEAVK